MKWLRVVVVLAAGIPFGVLLLVASFFSTTLPSSSQNVMGEYRQDVRSTLPSIHWEDVYVFDYWRYHNNFSKVSPQVVQSSVNLFVKKVVIRIHKTRVNRYGEKEDYTISKVIREPLSLLDVMMRFGYSQKDYQDALQVEDILESILVNSETSGPDGVLAPVTVQQLTYQPVSAQLLYDYVHQRDSMFSLQNMDVMIQAAQVYDVSPVLLLAITGQEESFDPVRWPAAREILKNPWNVYYSWQVYHVSFRNAAYVAAATLHRKLMYSPPTGENPIAWINDPNNPDGIYAQDRNWAYGVDDIYHSILAFVQASR